MSRVLGKAAFIDRDGVINEERGFVHRSEDFVFLPGAVEALRRLRNAGYLVVVVSNQSGIARGMYSETDYLHLTQHMASQLAAAGVDLAATEYCPHLPDAPVPQYRAACDCRKPKPGMLRGAAANLHIDLSRSLLVGDRATDIEAGRAAGIKRCFLVRSGLALSAADAERADAVYDDLASCVDHLLRDEQRSIGAH